MKLVTVFNACGINGKENGNEYFNRIHGLLNQRGVDQRVVLSGCRLLPHHVTRLKTAFRDRISYCLTDELLTVNQTFNLACLNAVKSFGMPGGFLYVDSGVHFESNEDITRTMVSNHQSGPWAMTAAMVSMDTGLEWWFPGQSENELFKGDLLDIPVGKTTNLHCQIFDRGIVEAYSRPLPDIMASYATESCFSFLCAGIRKKFGLWRNIRPRHDMSMDGASAGFPDSRGWRHLLPYAPRKMEDIVADPEAYESGMGYEECHGVLMHQGALYDADGRVADSDRLARFINANLFLPKAAFDYNAVRADWIP